MRSCLQSQYDLAEIYGPPRVVKEANGTGMKGGFSLDFAAPDPDGYIWDFSKHECRQKALARIRETRPYMIIRSEECTPFSIIQNLNKAKRNPEVVEAEVSRARIHLTWWCQFCQMHMDRGDIFSTEILNWPPRGESRRPRTFADRAV